MSDKTTGIALVLAFVIFLSILSIAIPTTEFNNKISNHNLEISLLKYEIEKFKEKIADMSVRIDLHSEIERQRVMAHGYPDTYDSNNEIVYMDGKKYVKYPLLDDYSVLLQDEIPETEWKENVPDDINSRTGNSIFTDKYVACY